MEEEKNDMALPQEMPQRETKIVNVKYPNGTSCDVIFSKLTQPIPASELEKIPREEKMNYCLEVPVDTKNYYVDNLKKVICLQDQPIEMRDGITIYADIYLPSDAMEKPVPLIISWSFFGKQPWHQPVQIFRPMGVPTGTVSDVCKFESSDPLYWCYNGYAMANVDPRGIGNSEGDQQQFGTQEGRDGYDFIEWAATQKWCTGKVALFGNSGVAMSQWRIAAEEPPHLTCIAPWEATGDQYRESLLEGGIPGLFGGSIVVAAQGKGFIDNTLAMAKKEPYVTSPYWQDKIPNFANIKIPTYTAANWNHFHNVGSWEGFNNIKSRKKWMRTHQTFEWPDTYNPKNIQDLQLFFDRYLKEIHNGWELTPKIRLEVMDAFEYPYQSNRPETEFPLTRTEYKKLYLNADNGKLGDVPVKNESNISYDGNKGEIDFEYTFRKDTEITGYMKLRLWVEAKGHDDMDLFINVKKTSTTGEELPVTIFGTERHPGTWGKLRVSARHLDEEKSTEYKPVLTFDRTEKLQAGQIVPIDIPLVPISRIWHKGQKLRIQIAGRYIRDEWFEPLVWFTDNKGEHTIHTGGKYESYLLVPVIPPKYEDGEYVYR
ncbi:MAG: CocE/NonD family hydrolase [Bacilli bacterium]|nr:CocE/NonD family hydrolase [Bacilli bacterium]